MTIAAMVCFMVAVTVFGVVSIYAICRLMAQLFHEDDAKKIQQERDCALAWAKLYKCDSCAHYNDADCPDYICLACSRKDGCICNDCDGGRNWAFSGELPQEGLI